LTALKIHVVFVSFSITPLSFDASSPRNPANIRINLILPETTVVVARLCYIFAADSMGLSSLKFSWWLRKRMHFETECEMAVQGHPRSLILVPIESVYETSYYSSIVILVLCCPVSQILQFSAEKSDPTFIPPEFWGVPLGLDCRCCESEERRPNYSCNDCRTN